MTHFYFHLDLLFIYDILPLAIKYPLEQTIVLGFVVLVIRPYR